MNPFNVPDEPLWMYVVVGLSALIAYPFVRKGKGSTVTWPSP